MLAFYSDEQREAANGVPFGLRCRGAKGHHLSMSGRWWRVAVGEEDMVGILGIDAARTVKEPNAVAL
jgi:hypothetical protein